MSDRPFCPRCSFFDCICHPPAPAFSSGVGVLVGAYEDAVAKLDAYRVKNFRPGGLVRVDCARFRGFGFAVVDGDCPPCKLAVMLENGNTWWYPIDSVVPVTDLRLVPRTVRRAKLRWSGYKLTGCCRLSSQAVQVEPRL